MYSLMILLPLALAAADTPQPIQLLDGHMASNGGKES
jgi:hypothetical protein